MPIPLRITATAHTQGLKDAARILGRNLKGGLEGLGKRLRASAAARMRRDTGGERRSLTIEVRGRDLNYELTVYSTLLRAFVDALGMRRGVFIPYGPGSRIYRWAARRYREGAGLDPAKKGQGAGRRRAPRTVSHLTRRPRSSRRKSRVTPVTAARTGTQARRTKRERAIHRLAFLAARSIFEHGIVGLAWHRKALEANKARIILDVRNALVRGVQEINRT
jgi:hypothetical protein